MALDLTDKTGNGNTLTNNNGVVDITASLASISGGNTDAAGFTAASSQYLSAVITPALKPTTSFTVEFWVKYSGANTFDYAIFQSGGLDNTASFFNGINIRGAGAVAGKVQFLIGGNGAGDTAVTAATAINDGGWHAVACVYDSTGPTMRIHLDGNSTADASAAGQTPVYSATPHFYIGTRSRDNDTKETYYDGQLDEMRFYSFAKTGAQIAAAYNIQQTGSEANFLDYHPFNAVAAKGVSGLQSKYWG